MTSEPADRPERREWWRARAVGAIGSLVLALPAGCSVAAIGDDPAVRTSAPAGATPGGAAPVSPPAVSPTPAQLVLAFAGDVHFTGRTLGLLDDPPSAIGPFSDQLAAADLSVANLETAVTERGRPEPKQYHFRAPATAYAALAEAGIDAVSLANNHVLDYGQVGLKDTLDAAEQAGFPVFGAGRDITGAYQPWLTEIRGTRLAVVGLSQVRTLSEAWAARPDRAGIAMAWDVDRSIAAVIDARRQADVVVVFNHWGQEGADCPSRDQRQLAKRLADAGADIIVGTHAHTLQGAGWLGSTYVAYGLGNFLWYSTSRSTDTGLLRVTIQGRRVLRSEFLPAVVSSTGQPQPLSGAAAKQASEEFASRRRCAELSSTPGG